MKRNNINKIWNEFPINLILQKVKKEYPDCKIIEKITLQEIWDSHPVNVLYKKLKDEFPEHIIKTTVSFDKFCESLDLDYLSKARISIEVSMSPNFTRYLYIDYLNKKWDIGKGYVKLNTSSYKKIIKIIKHSIECIKEEYQQFVNEAALEKERDKYVSEHICQNFQKGNKIYVIGTNDNYFQFRYSDYPEGDAVFHISNIHGNYTSDEIKTLIEAFMSPRILASQMKN